MAAEVDTTLSDADIKIVFPDDVSMIESLDCNCLGELEADNETKTLNYNYHINILQVGDVVLDIPADLDSYKSPGSFQDISSYINDADASAEPAYSQDFTVINNMGIDIYYLYVSRSDINAWEEDVLGEACLPDGEATLITFDNLAAADIKWDLRAEDVDGNGIEFYGLPLSYISTLELTYDTNTGEGVAYYE
jgi:hypothetical protein